MAADHQGDLGAIRSLAHSTASLISSDDLAGVLTHLLDDCALALNVGALGVMVVRGDGVGEVLSATSHEALEMELYESQLAEGPCMQCIRTGEPAGAGTIERLQERWPKFAEAVQRAGYCSAHARPMSWQGELIGALNLFWHDETELDERQQLLAQAFADLATIAIISSGRVGAGEAVARAKAALSTRYLIEQAKGALAYRSGIDMGAAYQELKRMTAESDRTLSQVAAEIMRHARQR